MPELENSRPYASSTLGLSLPSMGGRRWCILVVSSADPSSSAVNAPQTFLRCSRLQAGPQIELVGARAGIGPDRAFAETLPRSLERSRMSGSTSAVASA